MNMSSRLPLAIALAATLLPQSTDASWMDIPLDKLVRTEKLIVTGKLGELTALPAQAGSRAMQVGEITIDTVLKNEFAGSSLKVAEMVISPFDLKKDRPRHFNLSLTAPRTERMQYYVTLFVHTSADGGKRLYSPGGFNKVCQEENYQELNFELKPIK